MLRGRSILSLLLGGSFRSAMTYTRFLGLCETLVVRQKADDFAGEIPSVSRLFTISDKWCKTQKTKREQVQQQNKRKTGTKKESYGSKPIYINSLSTFCGYLNWFRKFQLSKRFQSPHWRLGNSDHMHTWHVIGCP